MYGEILQAIKALAITYALPYTAIDNGSLPLDNGLAMYIGAGALDETFLDKGSTNEIAIALNGKHETHQTLVEVLSNIHFGLTRRSNYPTGDEWQILNIETGSAPNLIEREGSGPKQWLYGSILEIKFFVKGV